MLKYAVNNQVGIVMSTCQAHPSSCSCILYKLRSIHNNIADAAVSRLVRDMSV